MTPYEIITASILLVTLIAIWRAPIQAVRVGQKLLKEKSDSDRMYANKFYVFATILGNRHAKGNSEIFVISLNQIPIIFHTNANVIDKFKTYIQSHKNEYKSHEEANKVLNPLLNDLVLAMAQDLGYRNIDNNLMMNFFYPAASSYRHQSEFHSNIASSYRYLDDPNVRAELGLKDKDDKK